MARPPFLDPVADTPLSRRLARSDERGNHGERPGTERLLRALVRMGLPERALISACALIAELDQPHEPVDTPQSPEQRLEGRQRIFAGRETTGGRKPSRR